MSRTSSLPEPVPYEPNIADNNAIPNARFRACREVATHANVPPRHVPDGSHAGDGLVVGRHAISAEDRTQAQLLCQNILQEVLAGARPLQNVSPAAFEGDNWVYMIDVESLEGMTLSKITVRVDRWKDRTGRLPTEDEMAGYQLVHWMRTGKQPTSSPDGNNP
jgi:hypothetical protein